MAPNREVVLYFVSMCVPRSTPVEEVRKQLRGQIGELKEVGMLRGWEAIPGKEFFYSLEDSHLLRVTFRKKEPKSRKVKST
jgi:hypothetical protein